LIAAGLALAGSAVGGAWLAHKVYAGELAKYKVLVQQLSISVNRQNAAVRAWVAEGQRLEARVRAAEARAPAIEKQTVERIKVVHETQPGPTAPCVEVVAWFRSQYNSWAQRWSSRP
jgi:hypothetical protein